MQMYNDRLTPSVIALGMFDGMHIGHRAVISRAVSLAKANSLQSVAFTFANHPRSVFSQAPAPLMRADEKKAVMREMGIDVVDMVVFDKTMASMSPKEFIENLVSKYDVRILVSGSDFTFGYKGLGNVQTLRELSGEYGYEVCEVPFVMLDGEKVSSTRIRKALLDGDTESADKMLGLYRTIRQHADG